MRELFFKKEVKKKRSKENDSEKTPCEICGLYRQCESPKMGYSGQGKKKILIIGEAPGRREDEEGVQFVGTAGKTLRKHLSILGIDVERDCWKTNAVICRPPKNRTPSKKEISLCHENLIKTIEELKPEKIFCFGKTPLDSLYDHRGRVSSMASWEGEAIPDQELNCWVFPMYHPQFLNYNKEDIVLQDRFFDSLSRAVKHKNPLPILDYEITFCHTEEEAIEQLEEVLSKRLRVAIDYEATGIKPHAEGHRILCMSVAYSQRQVVVFPMFDSKPFRIVLRKFLKGPVKKIAHNMKYEEMWTRTILGYSVENWEWDTMLAAHILNNTKGTIGLKHQGLVKYGIGGYDKEMKRLMVLKSKGINSFNFLSQAPIEKLMEYCAIDSILCFNLFLDQRKHFRGHLKKGYQLFHEGSLTLVRVEENGILVDQEYYLRQSSHLQRRMKRLEKKIGDHPMVCKFVKETGRPFNSASPVQMKKVFFDYMGCKTDKKTAKGNPSLDVEALSQIEDPLASHILEHRKLFKLDGTYISSFLQNLGDDGKLHPSFSLTQVQTYRSSSSNPNFQNVPKRDKEALHIIRSGIIPSPGNLLCEVDYSGIEVRISACYHKDPAMITYIEDPTTDMHRDQAMEIFMSEEVTKEQRYLAKNKFVFPQFYGSYHVLCAADLWTSMTREMKRDLRGKGITTPQKFQDHIKQVEKNFWDVRFPVYRDWKKKTYEEYLKEGRVRTLTGFYPGGLMEKNKVLNYPIQGAAFHCLLWSLIHVQKFLESKNMKTKIIGQIHDSIVLDVVPLEVPVLLPALKEIMCEDIRKAWDWIIVPLEVEIELSLVDGNWCEMMSVQKED